MSSVTNQLKEKLRSVLIFDQNMLILAAILGFLAGFASTFFRWMIEFFESVFSIKGLSLTGVPPQFYPFLLPLMPMLGGCIIGLICKYFPIWYMVQARDKCLEDKINPLMIILIFDW